MRFVLRAFRALPYAAAGLLCACSGNGASTSGQTLPIVEPHGTVASTPAVRHRRSSGKIQHVVIIVQENRSFNNLFYGYPGAKTSKYGYDSYGDKIKLQPVPLET